MVKDRLFFFGAIDPSWDRRTSLVPEGFPLRSVYPNGVDRNRRTMSYSAKATYHVTTNHHVNASFFGDPSKGENGPQRSSALLNTTTAGFSEIVYGGHNQTVRYEGIVKPAFLVEG